MRLLLVEDEVLAARRLERLVRAHLAPRACQLAHAATAAEAVGLLGAGPFDGVLLDLNLGGGDGFSVIRAAGDRAPFIVVSAYAERALEAFDHAVLDFVPKPVAAARLGQALDRLIAMSGEGRRQRLIVRDRGRAEVLEVSDIVCLRGADDYVELVLAGGRRLLHEDRLAALETRLPGRFLRVHRSHIVNLDHLSAVARTDAGLVATLTGGETAPVSRRRAAALKTWLS